MRARGPVRTGLLALVLMAALAIEPGVARVADASVPPAPAANDYAAHILAGIGNQGRNKQQPYVTAGDRTYLIGTQDGNFPDMGNHVPGEMGGLWLPPIKLIDGFDRCAGGCGRQVWPHRRSDVVCGPDRSNLQSRITRLDIGNDA